MINYCIIITSLQRHATRLQDWLSNMIRQHKEHVLNWSDPSKMNNKHKEHLLNCTKQYYNKRVCDPNHPLQERLCWNQNSEFVEPPTAGAGSIKFCILVQKVFSHSKGFPRSKDFWPRRTCKRNISVQKIIFRSGRLFPFTNGISGSKMAHFCHFAHFGQKVFRFKHFPGSNNSWFKLFSAQPDSQKTVEPNKNCLNETILFWTKW